MLNFYRYPDWMGITKGGTSLRGVCQGVFTNLTEEGKPSLNVDSILLAKVLN